jgi:hypothetical protein
MLRWVIQQILCSLKLHVELHFTVAEDAGREAAKGASRSESPARSRLAGEGGARGSPHDLCSVNNLTHRVILQQERATKLSELAAELAAA